MSRKKRGNDDDNGFAEWGGYMDAKKAKLAEQYEGVQAQTEKLSDIFNGIGILVNGLTHPNSDELKQLMAAHGGAFHHYQSSKTTHIIASNLPNVKINKLGSVPIVKPSWITDSIELGKLLDYRRYLLYTNQSSTQPRLNFPVVQTASETKTASDPSFLQEFYNNSRLHLISTLGAEFKQLIGQLRDNSSGIFPGLERLKRPEIEPKKNRSASVIMHIDMDCFFVSVGLRNRPDLIGKPVAVTHARNPTIASSKSREIEIAMNTERLAQRNETVDGTSSLSEIASCSYEARKCGVKNGMFLGSAVKLCPDLQTISYDFDGYRQVSHVLYNILATYTLDIEAVSCDEMYVDVTEILAVSGLSVDQWASHVRAEITEATGCPCSAGFGSNRLQARLATKKAKPNGQYHLLPENVQDYMADVDLRDLPGVGYVTVNKLRNLGLTTCGDLRVAALKTLRAELGPKIGETLLEQAKGIDKRPLNFHHERKSVSAEVNYGIRFKTLQECHDFLEKMSEEVCSRLTDLNMRARCITLKIMVRAMDAPVETAKFLGHGICDSLSKSATTNGPISDSKTIFRETKALYEKMNLNFTDLRGVGIQLTKLEKSVPISKALSNFLNQPSKIPDKVPQPKEDVEQDKSKTVEEEASETKSKKRGRPKGSKNSNKKPTTSKKKDTNASINKFFKVTKEQPPWTKNIDREVLRELPKEIRDEIMKEYNLAEKTEVEDVDCERVEIKETTAGSDQDEHGREANKRDERSMRPFAGFGWDRLKPVLYDWIGSESEPNRVDAEMLGDHLRSLAIDRQIEQLHVIFKFLRRNLEQMSCSWHKAYYLIADVMQTGMVARYGSVLSINKSFGCCRS